MHILIKIFRNPHTLQSFISTRTLTTIESDTKYKKMEPDTTEPRRDQ